MINRGAGIYYWRGDGDHTLSRAARYSVTRYLLCRCSLPLCVGSRVTVRTIRGSVLLVTQMDWTYVRRGTR